MKRKVPKTPEVFTRRAGKQVPAADTVRGFKEMLGGKHDSVSRDPSLNCALSGGSADNRAMEAVPHD